jgi:hypothetical protein
VNGDAEARKGQAEPSQGTQTESANEFWAKVSG